MSEPGRGATSKENDLTDIHHRIAVESPSTEDVYAALTTIDGLSGWWTTSTTGDPSLGGKIAFRFPAGGSTWR